MSSIKFFTNELDLYGLTLTVLVVDPAIQESIALLRDFPYQLVAS
jgi:hypothetical protein